MISFAPPSDEGRVHHEEIDSLACADNDPNLPTEPVPPDPSFPDCPNQGRDICVETVDVDEDDIDDDDADDVHNVEDADEAFSVSDIHAVAVDEEYFIGAIDDSNVFVDHEQGPRALFDTGAFRSCTNRLDWLHGYTEYTEANPSPVRLKPATKGSDARPLGYGYLHVPARNSQGYLAVRTEYSPLLRTTVIDDRSLIQAAGHCRKRDMVGWDFKSSFDEETWTYRSEHKLKRAYDVIIGGVLLDAKPFTDILLLPFRGKESINSVRRTDPTFDQECADSALQFVHEHQEQRYRDLRDDLSKLPVDWSKLPHHEYIAQNTPVLAIRKETERLLWHQRLGHPSDYYLYHAHKHVKGVPAFKHLEPILDRCPTCIRAKQTKNAPGPNSTRRATRPYQGLSIDFSFAGTTSKNSERAKDFVGFNGETCWILITDHYSRKNKKIGSTRVSKATPLNYLREFLKQYAPKDCDNKYVYLDQGGELYKNPAVRALFATFNYEIFPTGADASNQNGPVERGHLSVANSIRALLTGANLDVRFWPYAFHHWLRIDNSIPSRDQDTAPLKLADDAVDDFTHFRTFGCRVWVRPPGRRRAKFIPNSRKGVFLGFLPKTTRNIVWYDPETNRVKIATHIQFDEGMNDLAPDAIPPNVVHLQRTQRGDPIPIESQPASVPVFDVGSSPFFAVLERTLQVRCSDPLFGLVLAKDDLNNRVFVSSVKPSSSAARLYSSLKATNNKIRGAYLIRVGDVDVFTRDEAVRALRRLSRTSPESVPLIFAPEPRLTATQVQRAVREHSLFAPCEPEDIDTVHSISIADLRAIAAVRFPDDDSSASAVPISTVRIAINAIRSTATTPAEQALGHFTRRRLKPLDTWPLWRQGEAKQLNQFHDLGMYGPPVAPPKDAIILRQHWQYHIKRDGTRRARNCCDGSPRAAPALHRLAQTYSSCVEQSVQRLFFALCATLDYRVYGGDAKDAYAHSPPPERPTFVKIDDAYAEWYLNKHGVAVDRNLVLPVQHALQGHPESGRLWERHINAILSCPQLDFKSTTHDRTIYQGTIDGHKILLLRQVDLGCPIRSHCQEHLRHYRY